MIGSLIKSILRRAGIELYRRPTSFPADPYQAQKTLLSATGVLEPVIFDLGGHRGESIGHYRSVFPRSQIYSFEPSPDALAELKKRFRGDASTQIVAKAIADQPGRRTLHLYEIDQTNSLLPAITASGRYLPGREELKGYVEVDATSIDLFMEEQGLQAIHILKMDIQGAELSALQGAQKALTGSGLPIIYTEIMFVPHYENQPLFKDIWNFLACRGYTVFDLYYPQRAANGQLKYADALFINQDMRKNIVDAGSHLSQA